MKLNGIIVAAALALVGSPADAHPSNAVEIQFLTVSDWHAQLDPIAIGGVNVGGAAVLSSYWKQDRLANPNTLTLTAGDAFGGSPPLSAFFSEKPAVEAMNAMGFSADTFGNHNFDRGVDHLRQMVSLASFSYVSANIEGIGTELPTVAPYKMFTVGGVKVAVIGITNADAAQLVFPGRLGSLKVIDPVHAAIKARNAARQAGADLVVVIAHLGATGTDPVTGAPTGPLIDFASALEGIDVIFGDHTDFLVNTTINGALVVENRSKGATYARTKLTVAVKNNPKVVGRSVEFVTPIAPAVTPDPDVVAALAPYRAQLTAVFDGVIGESTGVFVRGGNVERVREVALGNLVTDSMRLRYGAELAFTNGGGLRSPLPSSYAPANTALRRNQPGYAAGPPYDLVVGDVFAVLPFGNTVVTRPVTGAQLWAAMEHGLSALPGANGRFPQISGFKVVFSTSRPAGSRVISITLDDGRALSPDSTVYTLATNDFVNAGGDGYTMLADGQGVTREVMADVLLDYVRSVGVVTPTTSGRLQDTP